ncbi:TdeIII family type II restriction endonuclease [Patescibacteria group bacterium]|nr:TdeIII family type II restriction endonuclease [Patescibacteria group bacterium]
MALSKQQQKEIGTYLILVIRGKLSNYAPETEAKPFHYRLLGRNRYAMFSFIHSMNTTFGMSIFEQVSVLIAKHYHKESEHHYTLIGSISSKTLKVIEKVHFDLRQGKLTAVKYKENSLIKSSVVEKQLLNKDPDSTVDVFVREKNGMEHYIDIISAKPNIKEFVELKRKLLRWTALRLSQDKSVNVLTQLAIPYNPYDPNPYSRWTLKGLFDLKKEIMVGEEYWDFLGGRGTYKDLLGVFEKVGLELYDEIDQKMKNLVKKI